MAERTAEATDPDDAPWPRRVTTQVGARVAHYRGLRKWSARALADETERVGYRVEPQVIANMETGRRSNVSVAEVFALAAALQVPPALIMVPLGEPVPVAITPTSVTDPWAAYAWVTGRASVDESDEMSHDARDVIEVFDRHDLLLQRLRRMREGDSGAESLALAIAATRSEMRRAGWAPPALTDDVGALVERAER